MCMQDYTVHRVVQQFMLSRMNSDTLHKAGSCVQMQPSSFIVSEGKSHNKLYGTALRA